MTSWSADLERLPFPASRNSECNRPNPTSESLKKWKGVKQQIIVTPRSFSWMTSLYMAIHAIPVQQNGGENIPPFSLVTYAFVRALFLVWCPVCIDFFFLLQNSWAASYPIWLYSNESLMTNIPLGILCCRFLGYAICAAISLDPASPLLMLIRLALVIVYYKCLRRLGNKLLHFRCCRSVLSFFFYGNCKLSAALSRAGRKPVHHHRNRANNRIKSSKVRIISMNHQCTSIVMSIPSRRPSDSDMHHNSWIRFRSDLFVSFPVDYGDPVTLERCKPRKILLQIVIQLHKKSNIDLLQQALQQFKTILSLCSPKHKTRQLNSPQFSHTLNKNK